MLRALLLIIFAGGLASCHPRRPRAEVTVWLDPPKAAPAEDVTVRTSAPPMAPEVHESAGSRIVVMGVPHDGDATAALEKAMREAYDSGPNATIVVTTRCLKDLEPGFRRDLLYFWHVAAVVGARCEGGAPTNIGAAAFVETNTASRIRITLDERTRAILRVEVVK